ncbi:MAG: HAD family hydrolase [Candidatus Aenigmarchaeota archaeon]|nr:HAD family hydrolase [Candidatus Aenigmarchaeota archaeon]
MTIKVISFDLDGTIVDFNYNKAFWDEAIPHLYSKRHKISLEEAKKIVFDDYKKLKQPDDARWYTPSFWFQRFDIGSFEDVAKDLAHHVRLYHDVIPSLKTLSRKFKLVVISNSLKEFVELKLEAEGIGRYFSKYYSVLDMFGGFKSPVVYKAILKDLGVGAKAVIHVGDDAEFDYFAARKAGLHAFLLNRGDGPEFLDTNATNRKVPPGNIIRNLNDLKKRVENL